MACSAGHRSVDYSHRLWTVSRSGTIGIVCMFECVSDWMKTLDNILNNMLLPSVFWMQGNRLGLHNLLIYTCRVFASTKPNKSSSAVKADFKICLRWCFWMSMHQLLQHQEKARRMEEEIMYGSKPVTPGPKRFAGNTPTKTPNSKIRKVCCTLLLFVWMYTVSQKVTQCCEMPMSIPSHLWQSTVNSQYHRFFTK